MAERELSKESLRAMAAPSGLKLGDDSLVELRSPSRSPTLTSRRPTGTLVGPGCEDARNRVILTEGKNPVGWGDFRVATVDSRLFREGAECKGD